MAVVSIVCPEKKLLFSDISLSRRTITRRIEEMSDDVQNRLQATCRKLEYFSIALDESTDLRDTAQLAVFVRGVTSTVDVVEEFFQIIPMRGTCTGQDIFEALIKSLSDTELNVS